MSLSEASMRASSGGQAASQQLVVKLLYSKAEAARMLNLSVRTVDTLIAMRELPVRRIGRRVLIPHSALIAFARVDHVVAKAA